MMNRFPGSLLAIVCVQKKNGAEWNGASAKPQERSRTTTRRLEKSVRAAENRRRTSIERASSENRATKRVKTERRTGRNCPKVEEEQRKSKIADATCRQQAAACGKEAPKCSIMITKPLGGTNSEQRREKRGKICRTSSAFQKRRTRQQHSDTMDELNYRQASQHISNRKRIRWNV